MLRSHLTLLAALALVWGCGSNPPSRSNENPDIEEDTTPDVEEEEVAPDPFGILTLDPSRLDFTGIAPNTAISETVRVENTGTERFRVFEVAIEGDSAFSFRIEEGVVFPSSWEPGESFELTVTFNPTETGPATATIRVDHDAEEGDEALPMTGNSEPPCVEIAPEGPFFMGGHEPGGRGERELLFHNCSGSEQVEITELRLEGDEGFSIGRLPNGTMGDAFDIRPGFDANLSVFYEGTETASATLHMTTNDSARPTIALPFWSAGESACPSAVARCAEMGTEDWSNTIRTTVGEPLECDASTSVTDGEVAEVYWEVISRPDGGHWVNVPRDAVPPAYAVDTPGSWELWMHVRDEAGQTSCLPSPITITAEAAEDLQILLEWTAEDPAAPVTEGDANLDLHLLRDGFEWGDAENDFSAANSMVEWGELEQSPMLTDGSRYERVSVVAPDTGYSVGVSTEQAATSGETRATVYVYWEGELVYTGRDRDLTAEGAFWEVLSVTDGGALTIVDEVTIPE